MITSIALAWWEHRHRHQLCRTVPDLRNIESKLKHTRRSHSLGRITSTSNTYRRLFAAVFRALPSYRWGERGDREARKKRWGRSEAAFVAALVAHFTREALLTHPLDDCFPATNDQLIKTAKRVAGIKLDGSQFRRVKLKFIGPNAAFTFLVCVRQGYRTERVGVPSLYQLTDLFIQFIDLYNYL
jgi:hypothetical protein